MSSVACSAGFASCKTFGKQPKHPCFVAKPPYRSSAICTTASCSGFVRLTASILAWSRGGSPSNIAPARMPGVYAQRLYARTHTSGRTKSVQDAPTTNDHSCTGAKPSECPKGDRDNKSEVYFKNRLFLQAVSYNSYLPVF